MTHFTADAPVRANKAKPKAKAIPSPILRSAAEPAHAAQPVDETSLAAAKALGFVSVLMSGIRDIPDFDESLGAATALFELFDARVADMAYGDDKIGPVPISKADIDSLSVLIQTALEQMEASSDSLPGGTVLLVATLGRQAEDLLERIADALEASPATLGPLKALSTYSGVRPQPQRAQQSPRRVEATPEGAHNQTQLLTVLTEIASVALTQADTLALAGQSGDKWHMRTLIDCANVQARLIGAMADSASGCNIRGGHDTWLYGPNFANEGKAGAA